MKSIAANVLGKGLLLLALGIALSVPHQAPAISFTFASLSGSSVRFDGNTDTFQFLPNDANDFSFSILNSSEGSSSVGLLGRIEGQFQIGAINAVGLAQGASVSGVGKLVIQDQQGQYLTGDLAWNNIVSLGTSFLSGGIINVQGEVNLTGISYSGSSQDLLSLAAAEQGATSVGFLFRPGKSLTQLTADGSVNSAGFAGTVRAEDVTLPSPGPGPIAVPDSGRTLMLLGIACAGLAALHFTLRARCA